jgi:N-methylhydantoinase A/oxoprolinase/acetone carboxylase beta subunit
VKIERFAEMRYRGQSHELSIEGGPRLVERFHQAHMQRFGFESRESTIEVDTVEARGALPGRPLPRARARRMKPVRPGQTMVRAGSRAVRADLHAMGDHATGDRVRGPAIVAEAGATLWVPAGWRGIVHASGTLVLTRGRR